MPRKVIADGDKCEGHANCVIAAPDVFSLDNDNIVVVLMGEPSHDQVAAVEAVRSCPVEAVSPEEN